MRSAFQHTDLNTNMLSGWVNDPEAGHLPGTMLHLDAKNIEIVDKKEEGHLISIETVSLMSDINGFIQDSNLDPLTNSSISPTLTKSAWQFRAYLSLTMMMMPHGSRLRGKDK
jgi:hypothetical protein